MPQLLRLGGLATPGPLGGSAFGLSSPIQPVRVALRATTGTQDFTVSGFGTPVAAFFVFDNTPTDALAKTDIRGSIGATDGTNQWVMAGSVRSAVTDTDTFRRAATDEVIMLLNTTTGAVIAEANFDSWVTDGVRINVTVTVASAPLLTVYLIGGFGVTAAVGSGALAGISAVKTFTPNLETNALLVAHTGLAMDDTARAQRFLALGFGSWDGATVLQASYAHTSVDAVAVTDVRARADAAKIVTFHDTRTATLGNITSTEFDLTSSANDLTGTDIGYLAINLGASRKAWVGTLTTPTTTGEKAFSGMGFSPSTGLLIPNMMTTDATGETDAKAGAFAISGFTAAAAFCQSWADEDAETVTDAQSLTDDKAVNLDADDGTDAFECDFTSFDVGGVTLDFTITDGASRLWPALFMR